MRKGVKSDKKSFMISFKLGVLNEKRCKSLGNYLFSTFLIKVNKYIHIL